MHSSLRVEVDRAIAVRRAGRAPEGLWWIAIRVSL
jgi:hypothetical protein